MGGMAEYSLTPARVPGSWVSSFSPDLFSRGPAQGLPGVGRGRGSAFAGRLRLGCGSRNDPLGSAMARCVTARGFRGPEPTHNPKVAGSNPAPATIDGEGLADASGANPLRLPRNG